MPSTRSKDEELEQPINEVEHFVSIRHRIRECQAKYNLPETNLPNLSLPDPKMADGPQNRPLKDYAAPSQEEPHNSIATPAIAQNDFELKPSLLQAVQQDQFSGCPTDDPNLHLSVFVQYVDIVKANGVSPEAIRLCLFPFSLQDRDRAWLQSLPSNSITRWNELKKVFLA